MRLGQAKATIYVENVVDDKMIGFDAKYVLHDIVKVIAKDKFKGEKRMK